MAMAEEKKCPMEGCNCAVPEGQEYCSDYCKEHQAHGGHECGCGHAGSPEAQAWLRNRHSPDREPPLQVLLDLEVLLEDALQVELGHVVALFSIQRDEGVERAPLEEVDQVGVLGFWVVG